MDTVSELRKLGIVEAYLTDLICDVRNPRYADILMQALMTVQQALVRVENRYPSVVSAVAKSSIAP
jgi:hypothetical protein